MIWWIVDNVAWVTFIMGVLALCFGLAWTRTRNNKLLYGVAMPVAFGVLAYVLSLFIVTDRMQLVRNVENMRDLVNDKKLQEAIEHFDDVVHIESSQGPQDVKKVDLAALAKLNMGHHAISRVVANNIQVTELARPKATVTFYIGPEDGSERGRCIMGFVLSADGKWRVKTCTVETLVGGQKLPVGLPF